MDKFKRGIGVDQAAAATKNAKLIKKALKDIEGLYAAASVLIRGTLPAELKTWGETEVVSILDHIIGLRPYIFIIDKHWAKGYGFESLKDAYAKLKLLESFWGDFIQHFRLELYENHLTLSFRGK